MDKKLQQRIVGSIAVIALLILVLPHLFSSNVPTVPTRNTGNSSNDELTNSHQGNSFDDFQTSVISVDPIPTINSDPITSNVMDDQLQTSTVDTPINENIWSNVTEQTPTVPLIPNQNSHSDNSNSANTSSTNHTQSQLSVAERLLAESQANKPISDNNTNAPQLQLPKIELIGSTQSNKPHSNAAAKTQVAAQAKFTWYIQVGSYSSKENAEKVMSDYRKKGYPSEVVLLSGQYKVRIGPLKTQNNAKNVQAELKRQGVNSYIIQI